MHIKLIKAQKDSNVISISMLFDVFGIHITCSQAIYIKQADTSLIKTKYIINNYSLHFVNNLDSNKT